MEQKKHSKSLKQRAEEVARLDAARTQGEWGWNTDHLHGGYSGLYSQDTPVCVPNACNDGDEGAAWFEEYLTGEDASFIAHAPKMAALIADQQVEIERLKDTLEVVGIIIKQTLDELDANS